MPRDILHSERRGITLATVRHRLDLDEVCVVCSEQGGVVCVGVVCDVDVVCVGV